MRDPIEREDAINAIYHHLPSVSMDWARMVMHDVPTAKRKTGKWVHYWDGFTYVYECSECGHLRSSDYDYCEKCGTRMEGVREIDR